MDIKSKLTSKDDKYACAIADKIIAESQETEEWYEYFDEFASLLNHPKSLVRNRVLYILAANVQWDDEKRFDLIVTDFLSHITDEKPITARQCIKALAQIGQTKQQYIPTVSYTHLDVYKRQAYKVKLEEEQEYLYSFLHTLLGPEIIEIFDNK